MIKIPNRQTQKGSVLLVAIMVLIVLTLLTFSSSKSVILQEKMTASSRDAILALEAAEAALREAELSIKDKTKVFTAAGSASGRYEGSECESDSAHAQCAYLTSLKDVFADSSWTKSTKASSGVNCGNGDANCEIFGDYIIVRLGPINLTLTGDGEVQAIHSDSVEMDEMLFDQMFKYKIIARGVGLNPDTQRILVSYYAARVSKNN